MSNQFDSPDPPIEPVHTTIHELLVENPLSRTKYRILLKVSYPVTYVWTFLCNCQARRLGHPLPCSRGGRLSAQVRQVGPYTGSFLQVLHNSFWTCNNETNFSSYTKVKIWHIYQRLRMYSYLFLLLLCVLIVNRIVKYQIPILNTGTTSTWSKYILGCLKRIVIDIYGLKRFLEIWTKI